MDQRKGACRCGAHWNGLGVAHCTRCHETFRGDAGFDAHRVGAHLPGQRRCRTSVELESRGYAPDSRGYWRVPRPAESLPMSAA
jgi:hypothetical protein